MTDFGYNEPQKNLLYKAGCNILILTGLCLIIVAGVLAILIIKRRV